MRKIILLIFQNVKIEIYRAVFAAMIVGTTVSVQIKLAASPGNLNLNLNLTDSVRGNVMSRGRGGSKLEQLLPLAILFILSALAAYGIGF